MFHRILLLLLCFEVLSVLSKIVATTSGDVEGYQKTSFGGRKFFAFEGIPYAEPPTGDKRFKEPQLLEKWEDSPLQANSLTECPQIEDDTASGTEDCLHLNIYTPSDFSNSTNFGVIVHIHGGGFMMESSHEYTSPSYFMDHNLVFVTFNYRLGILGFLSTEDYVLPGNNGLKDQIAALTWIKKNAQNFGGNPNSITLSGVSAGGASVHLHYFSARSRGLFQRGFSRSGCALNSWVFQTRAAEKAKILGASLNCSSESSLDLVKCLREKNFGDVVKATKLFYKFKHNPIAPFGPVVEKHPNGFITEHPYELLAQKKAQNLPWVASFVADDSQPLLSEFRDNLEELDLKWATTAPFLLHFNDRISAENWTSVSEKIRKEYFAENEKISTESFPKLVKLLTDRITVTGVAKSAQLQSEIANSSIFLYVLSYTGDSKKTVEHYDDNKYFYHRKEDNLTENLLKMKDILLKMLVKYSETGKPTIDNRNWPPVEPNQLNLLKISGFKNTDFAIEVRNDLGKVRFWDSLLIKEKENAQTHSEL